MSDLNEYHLALLYILGPIIAGAIFVFFKAKIKCVDKIEKRTFRQSKGMLNMAANLDTITNRLHPEEKDNSNFYEQMERDLKDENGNL